MRMKEEEMGEEKMRKREKGAGAQRSQEGVQFGEEQQLNDTTA